MSATPDKILLSKLFLDLQNPRFEQVLDETEAIGNLAKDEKVAALAEDIIEQKGLNPLEIVGVMSTSGVRGKTARYTVLEGNRRVCAIKLLNDPDLAPPDLRGRFKKLATKWKEMKSLDVMVFGSRDEVKPWLERLHEGEKDGVGRKAWNAVQKQRFTGSGKNAQAMRLLEVAENQGWVDKDETEGLLTTVQRFLSNPILRNQLGIEGSDREVLRRSIPQDDFNKLAERFIKDAVESKSAPMKDRLVHSRANGADIVEYANNLARRIPTSGERIEPEVVNGAGTKQTRKSKPKPPAVPKSLQYDKDVYAALKGMGNQKLTDIYYSICSLDLAHYSVLISVGLWSFFECLTAAVGRSEGVAMAAFLGRDYLQKSCGIEKDDSKAVWAALDTISKRGNDSKHHAFAGSYDPKEINNNWVVTSGVIKSLVEMLKKKKK